MTTKTDQELLAEAIGILEAAGEDKEKKATRVFNKIHLNVMDKGRESDLADEKAIEDGDYDKREEIDFNRGKDVAHAVKKMQKVRDYVKANDLPADSTGNPQGHKRLVRNPLDLGKEHGVAFNHQNPPGTFKHDQRVRNLEFMASKHEMAASNHSTSDPAKAEQHRKLATKLRSYLHGFHQVSNEYKQGLHRKPTTQGRKQ